MTIGECGRSMRLLKVSVTECAHNSQRGAQTGYDVSRYMYVDAGILMVAFLLIIVSCISTNTH